MIGAEPGVHRSEVPETAHQQPGAYQQHRRQRHLRDGQGGTQPIAADTRVAGRASCLQPVPRICTRDLERRRQPGQQARRQTGRAGEQHYPTVDVNAFGVRQVRGRQGRQQLDSAVRDQQAKATARGRDEEVLGHDTLHHPPARCAERAHHGEFTPPREPAGQHEVGDVRARHQQHESHGAHERLQRRADRSHQIFLQRAQHDAFRHVGQRGTLLRLTPRHRVDLRLGLRAARARSHTRDHAKRVRPVVAGQGDGQDEIDVHRTEHPHRIGDDTDDRVRAVTDRQHSADHCRISAEAPVPEPAGDHGCRRASGSIAALFEQTSPHRREAEHVEELRADAKAGDGLGGVRRDEVVAAGGKHVENGEGRECAALRAQREIVVHRKTDAAATGRPAPDLNDVVGVRERKGAERHRVHDTEDHRVRADAQTEDRGGGQRKQRCAPQRSESKTNVLRPVQAIKYLTYSHMGIE